MDEGLKRLYTGDFTNMNQEEQSDGTRVVILSSTRYPETYRFRVKDLYKESEQVFEHDIIMPEAPPHIKARIQEASRESSKGKHRSQQAIQKTLPQMPKDTEEGGSCSNC